MATLSDKINGSAGIVNLDSQLISSGNFTVAADTGVATAQAASAMLVTRIGDIVTMTGTLLVSLTNLAEANRTLTVSLPIGSEADYRSIVLTKQTKASAGWFEPTNGFELSIGGGNASISFRSNATYLSHQVLGYTIVYLIKS